MTKFKKLNEAILNLGKNWEIKNMNEKNLAPIIDREKKHEDNNRRDLLIALGQIRTDLGFLQPDIRYKWERKEIMNGIDDLMELIAKKRFF
tara:strand:- start:74 stop:346 length:273 start_codon:yes stop_codon:yes gene_type:complete